MATRSPGSKAFLSNLRRKKVEQPKKSVNAKLEAMVEKLMDEAVAGKLDFEQQMAVGALALKIEAVRNKLSDDDYGSGFMTGLGEDDEPETGGEQRNGSDGASADF